jgi:hypothetical protein
MRRWLEKVVHRCFPIRASAEEILLSKDVADLCSDAILRKAGAEKPPGARET